MARIVVEVIVLCLIVAALVSLARRWNSQRGGLYPASEIAAKAPPTAVWRAMHVGNERNQTEVLIVLQVPGRSDVWDRRTCTVIENQDPEYDKLLYNAMEDAKSRAALLNSMRDT